MLISADRVAPLADAVGRLDARETSDLRRPEVLEALEACGRLAAAARLPLAIMAAEVAARSPRDASSLARREGYSSAERLVAARCGVSIAEAIRLIEAGRAFMTPDDAGPGGGGEPEGGGGPEGGPDDGGGGPGDGGGGPGDGGGGPDGGGPPPPPPPPLGPVAAALRDGRIGTDAAALIRETLRALSDPALPGALGREARLAMERDLVARACTLDLRDLRACCARLRASHDARSRAERERRLRAQRHLTFTEQSDGMVLLQARLDPESALPVRAWFDAQVKRTLQAAKESDVPDSRSSGQIRADLMVQLANHGLRCGSPGDRAPAQVIVHVELESLRSGLGEVRPETAGLPLSVESVRRMCADIEIIPAVLGSRSLPLDVGRRVRPFSAAQRRALAARDGGCAWCGAPAAWCEAHHIVPWARGGGTDLSNGVLLCRGCHLRIHDTRWEVEVRGEEVVFIPPPEVDAGREPRPAARQRTAAPRGGRDRGGPAGGVPTEQARHAVTVHVSTRDGGDDGEDGAAGESPAGVPHDRRIDDDATTTPQPGAGALW
ncbi:DUF222 domain-containing protein [Demequina sp. SYSU T00039]|uniref:DUF222 domain-containing protein n=1 Tax=Demequina lignilytica TaxID=3051663 RepID=A0AAW7M7S1_9MICO|nr:MULTISPECIES: HNH endonuclease signature motif containing protein [unclassified Demequina]MDN4477077.1 DUF222 domain-containing protein [Demequina sp. SYSU T00039-1]MDN4487250.1 DUF222 domain-containing protein [Demequina sp. SYSU T00039]MDN4491501.1 DUF222 domain-containing protein [Demequina sp. SYSU T00068]